jgi:hypothetical protein
MQPHFSTFAPTFMCILTDHAIYQIVEGEIRTDLPNAVSELALIGPKGRGLCSDPPLQVTDRSVGKRLWITSPSSRGWELNEGIGRSHGVLGSTEGSLNRTEARLAAGSIFLPDAGVPIPALPDPSASTRPTKAREYLFHHCTMSLPYIQRQGCPQTNPSPTRSCTH